VTQHDLNNFTFILLDKVLEVTMVLIAMWIVDGLADFLFGPGGRNVFATVCVKWSHIVAFAWLIRFTISKR